MRTDKFFSRKNIHVQIWAGIGGIIGVAFTTLINTLSGPSKVVVDTESTKTQPISVNVVDGQGATKHDIEKLTAAISVLSATAAKQDENSELKAVKRDLSKLQATLERQSRGKENNGSTLQNTRGKTPANGSSNNRPQQAEKSAAELTAGDMNAAIKRWSADDEQSDAIDDLAAPLDKTILDGRSQTELLKQALAQNSALEVFSLPPTVKGYTTEILRGVKGDYCPPEMLKPGVPITVGFELQNASLLKTASPFIMSINRVDGEYSQTQVDTKQTPLTSGANSVTSTVHLSPGIYQVSYGYYLKNKLNGEFPPFYAKVCTVRIPANNI
ncbi:hypothetical protein [Pseudomonas sp. NPDC099000]|uniref:hypothetical protein n=1 Tax=Pseudomonas sp. NPDC099000 TaxID=3364488 RepID=UPI00383BE247